MQDTHDPRLRLKPKEARRLVHLFWYGRKGPDYSNRVRFVQDEDEYGLPRPVFDVRRSAEDRREAAALLDDLRAAVSSLGTPLPLTPPQLLPPGSSQHLMGTTRVTTAGPADGVATGDGRVWEFENLYLGGTGLIPGATTTSPTLTAVALGLRTASAVARSLGRGPDIVSKAAP
jgi:pyranose oxidase